MKYLYHDGKIRSADLSTVSVKSHAFNYGTAAFEGMRAFYDSKQKTWQLFRPERHYQRLKRGAEILNIDFSHSCDDFLRIISRLIKKNNYRGDLYIRPIVFHNALGVGLMRIAASSMTVFLQKMPLKPTPSGR